MQSQSPWQLWCEQSWGKHPPTLPLPPSPQKKFLGCELHWNSYLTVFTSQILTVILQELNYQPKHHSLLCSIFRLFIVLMFSGLKIARRNKFVCSEFNPLQSSRSKLTTGPRKGCLLRFWLNSTVTSNGNGQKLGNNFWYDSESIATNVCRHIGNKWNAMFESHNWQNKLLCSIQRFFQQHPFLKNQLLC